MNRFTSAMTVAALLICGLVGCNQESTTAKKPDASIVTPADNKQAFITLAKHLTDHWTTDRNAPRRQMDPTQMLAEAQQLFLDFDAIKTDDPALVKIRDEGKSGIQQGTTALRTIDQLPSHQAPATCSLPASSTVSYFVLTWQSSWATGAESGQRDSGSDTAVSFRLPASGSGEAPASTSGRKVHGHQGSFAVAVFGPN